MTEALLLLIALAVSAGALVLVAVKSLEALRQMSSQLERAQIRAEEMRNELLDRLMARDFDHYKAYELAETNTTEPDEVPDEELRAQRPWIPGPIEPQDTPPDVLEELEALERANR